MCLFDHPDFFLVVDIPVDDGPVATPAGKHTLVYWVPRHRTCFFLVAAEGLYFLLHISDIEQFE